jgi:cysteine dioxygenase
LSTHVESSTPLPIEVKQALSLNDLIELLQGQTEVPSLEQLNTWLESADISEAELGPYIAFKEANYWRHRVCRNGFVEMLVLCWGPGHRTPIHDHNGSHGAVKVFSGVLWETTFTFDSTKGLCYKAAREYCRGEITGASVPDIHQLGNPDVSEQNLITLHIYAPPLGVLKTYKAGSPLIDTYTPDESAE